MISPIVVIKVGDHWEARCHSLLCEMRHVVATGRTCGEAEAAAMPHLREVAGPARVERADTRVAPPEWPPRVGDVWRDQHGAVWFAVNTAAIDETDVPEVVMQYAGEDFRRRPDQANQQWGPLTLVWRERVADNEPTVEPCDECETTGRNCTAHRDVVGELLDDIRPACTPPEPAAPGVAGALRLADAVAVLVSECDELRRRHRAALDVAAQHHDPTGVESDECAPGCPGCAVEAALGATGGETR